MRPLFLYGAWAPDVVRYTCGETLQRVAGRSYDPAACELDAQPEAFWSSRFTALRSATLRCLEC